MSKAKVKARKPAKKPAPIATPVKTTFQTVIAELASAFETGKRKPSGDTFYRLKDGANDGASEWIKSADLMHDVHKVIDGRLPDDWIYEHVARVADALTGYDRDDADSMRDVVHEIADGLVDIYNHDRAQWLADHNGNAALVDEACEELGSQSNDIMERIGLGQYMVLERIANAVIDACAHEANEREGNS